MKWCKWFFGIVCCIVQISTALAYDEPAVNLGYTSFFDGGPPAGPGFYFQDYFQYYTTNRLNDNKGKRLPFPRNDVDVAVNTTQLIYLSTKKIVGANLGVSALLPWVINANVDDGLNNAVLKIQDGPSDLFIGPALQYDPIMRKDGKGPLFVHRFALDIIAPMGEYDNFIAINPGGNFWAINPYWAATIWITPKWSSSTRLHYLWNAKNHDPNIAFGPTARTTQAGQAVFGNFATNYAITEKFNVGINGYFFDQFTDTRVNDINVPGRREKVWAIGPGALYNISKNLFLFCNLYIEQDARNRPQGTSGILRFTGHFG
ncbi:Protein involved in meta-pathway of phenol degradation [Legionella lansingensis]|uniref:Phenol degradation protein meta n=1 Tax=Legionella lansingensis TaxID=45067 RepID=A0A0W0VYB8_9GAMM|nr:transporter [Legionella lansingensis]KTD25009.1 hypothetical protein Llan_0246 [Legionella lansingensis]SNV48689.1 Protein involved in meta-pathway of phenol degradation [Legionella lansingensis]